MAPRTGPRGVTNEDVANRAGVTYVYAPETPAQQNQVNQQALLSYVLGGQAPGYGKKYGGFPTAGYGQAAIEGQAFGIADLARQAAQQAAVREAELYSSADRQLRPIESQTASEMRRAQRQAESTFGGLSKSEDPMARYIGQKITGSRFQDLSAQREADLERQQAPIRTQFESDIASQVEPARQIGQTLGAFTPSQLAQEIAVSRYGYDPMLAAGLFGGQMDVDYYDRARQAERQALGFGSTNEEYLFDLLGPEEYRKYQENKALQTYDQVFAPDYSETDRNLQEAYGVDPSSIVNIDTDTARQIMNDNTFLASVNSYRTSMETNQDDFVSGEEAANAYAKDYLASTGDPVRAQILLDILRQYSFLIGT